MCVWLNMAFLEMVWKGCHANMPHGINEILDWTHVILFLSTFVYICIYKDGKQRHGHSALYSLGGETTAWPVWPGSSGPIWGACSPTLPTLPKTAPQDSTSISTTHTGELLERRGALRCLCQCWSWQTCFLLLHYSDTPQAYSSCFTAWHLPQDQVFVNNKRTNLGD